MKRLVEFPLQGGAALLVEVEEPEPEGGLVRAGRGEGLVERASMTLVQALGRVRPAGEKLLSELRELTPAPDSIAVEFGIKLGAETGAFVASAASEANFKVTLRWDRARSPEV
jgi:hypothetical protein